MHKSYAESIYDRFLEKLQENTRKKNVKLVKEWIETPEGRQAFSSLKGMLTDFFDTDKNFTAADLMAILEPHGVSHDVSQTDN